MPFEFEYDIDEIQLTLPDGRTATINGDFAGTATIDRDENVTLERAYMFADGEYTRIDDVPDFNAITEAIADYAEANWQKLSEDAVAFEEDQLAARGDQIADERREAVR